MADLTNQAKWSVITTVTAIHAEPNAVMTFVCFTIRPRIAAVRAISIVCTSCSNNQQIIL